MDISELRAALAEIDKINNETWLGSLTPRKTAELEYHNRTRDPDFIKTAGEDTDTYERFYANRKYYNTVKKSSDYLLNWIEENARGKVFLDYACGGGGNALVAAKAGAKLSIGLDISDTSIKNSRRSAKEQGLEDNSYFIQADAENTRLPDNSIDTIICSGVLHHLDLSYAFPELRRILKPGGKILAGEALDYNPFIKLYRMLTPEMRTEWEKAHILSLKDVAFASRFFELGEIKYWHVVSYIGGKFPILLPALQFIDVILVKIPLVQRMAWIFTFELIKPQSK